MNFKIELIDEARKWYRLYSVWFFVVLGALPDIYNAVVAAGLLEGIFPAESKVPALFSRLVNLIALAGLISRMVKQKKLEYDMEHPIVAPGDPTAAVVSPPIPGLAVVSPIPAKVADAIIESKADELAKAAAEKAEENATQVPSSAPPAGP